MSTCLTLSACSIDDNDNNNQSDLLNDELRQVISAQNIKVLTVPDSTPSVESNIVQLGKKLFFTKALSGNMDTACASCHHPNLGGGDDLPLPIGVEALNTELLGPGRLHAATGGHHDGGPTVPRNAPTTFNFGFYDKAIFHDGRIENHASSPARGGVNDPIRTPDVMFADDDPKAGANLAAAQARFPVTSAEEMRGFTFEANNSNADVRAHLQARLQGTNNELAKNEWLIEFQTGFSDTNGTAESLITFDNIAFAMGEYERSQVLVDIPWHDYLNGDNNAISESAKRGALLFYNSADAGGFGCASCHSGAFFTDEKYHVIAIPQIGRGKGDGVTGDDDFGRFRETKVEDDKYAFRTSHLVNITDTAPYGHDGAYATLNDMVKHHLNAEQAIADYVAADVQTGIQTDNWQANTNAALAQLKSLRTQGKSQLLDHSFTETDVDDVVAFLKALEDPCTQSPSCMNKWSPAADEADPDGLRLIAVDAQGNLL